MQDSNNLERKLAPDVCNIIVYPLIFQRSICWNPTTAIYESQVALNPKNTPTKEDEIFTGLQTQRIDDI
jgi:hypothetical protein